MGCEECLSHSIAKIKNDPPENHISSTRNLFDWVVNYMNDVNARLGKKLYRSDILWDRFTSGDHKVCENCGGKSESVREENRDDTKRKGLTLSRLSSNRR